MARAVCAKEVEMENPAEETPDRPSRRQAIPQDGFGKPQPLRRENHLRFVATNRL